MSVRPLKSGGDIDANTGYPDWSSWRFVTLARTLPGNPVAIILSNRNENWGMGVGGVRGMDEMPTISKNGSVWVFHKAALPGITPGRQWTRATGREKHVHSRIRRKLRRELASG